MQLLTGVNAADRAVEAIRVNETPAESSQHIPAQRSLEVLEVPDDDLPAFAALFEFEPRSRRPAETAFLELLPASTRTRIVPAYLTTHGTRLGEGSC
jgi:hypothetical protein